MSNYVKSTKGELKSQSRYAADTAKDALHSQAWLYPIKGVLYFATHKTCWAPFARALPPALALSAVVVGGVFGLLYLPQAAFMSVINFGPIGFISAIPLCLSEAYLVSRIRSHQTGR